MCNKRYNIKINMKPNIYSVRLRKLPVGGSDILVKEFKSFEVPSITNFRLKFTKHISYIMGMSAFGIFSISLCSGIVYAAQDIQNNIYNLRNNTNNSNDTFYSRGNMTTYSSFGARFSQNYNNGTLIIGNNTKNPKSNSEHTFGSGGILGFITASFSAKEVYLTGNINTGNSFRTGGGTNLSFRATGDLNVNQAAITVRRAGLQNHTTTLNGRNIYIVGSRLNIENVNGGGMQIGTNSSNTSVVNISNTQLQINGGTLTIGNSRANVNIDSSSSINMTGGRLVINTSNRNSLSMNISGDIVNGRIKPTPNARSFRSFRAALGNNGQDFSANTVKLTDVNNSINANNVNIDTLEFVGPGTVFGNGDRNLTISSSNGNSINIKTITNPFFFFGKGFASRLTTNVSTTIDNIAHRNYTGGSQIIIDSQNADLEVKNMSFATNGIFGSQGLIELKGNNINIGSASSGSLNTIRANAKGAINADNIGFGSDVIGSIGHIDLTAKDDINIKNLSGRAANYMTATSTDGNIKVENLTFVQDICITNGCGGMVTLKADNGDVIVKSVLGGNDSEQGIRAGNFLIAEGQNFYGGAIKAYALPTAGSDSTLDLSKITGDVFIDNFNIRTGTFKASNFHLNNFSVSKSNSYSVVSVNIGKSFINSLQMDLGTSNFADGSDIRFTGGGSILNFNLIDARATSFTRMQNIDNTNVNTLNITQADFYMKNGIFNSITVKNGQTGFGIFNVTNDAKITGNAMNVNSLLHLKNGSIHSGRLEIVLNANNTDVNQDFSKYLKVGARSNEVLLMSKEELRNIIQEGKDKLGNTTGGSTSQSDYENASGTYITTSDNKHYLLLPDIKTHDEIINGKDQVENNGTLLIEQTALKKGTLGNYGTILLDSGAHYTGKSTALLTLEGNLDNYNKIDIGANSEIIMQGNFVNKGELIFRLQANTKDKNATDVKFGNLGIIGNATLDVSMGTPGAFRADILDMKSLQNLKLATMGADGKPVAADSDANTYRLITLTSGTINYVFTQGDYTTTFNKSNNNYTISTSKNNGNTCINNNCQTTGANGQTVQETYYTTNNANNPWDMDKALVNDKDGSKLWNGIGDIDNEGNYIHKLSQSDKQKECNNDYCGFANANASEAERGYNYAQERMKSAFSVSYNGASIDSKYLQVERVATENMIGFRVLRRDISNFKEGGQEKPLCAKGSSAFDCVLYMEAGGNNSWINAIKSETANSYDILKNLFYNDNSAVLFLLNIDQTLSSSRNLNYFLEVARTIDSTFKHISDLSSKSSSINILSMAMESSKVNRLTKISALHGVGSPIKNQEVLAFEAYQRNLKQAIEVAQMIKKRKKLSMNNYNSANSSSDKLSSYNGFMSEKNDSGIAIMNQNSLAQNFIVSAKYDGELGGDFLSEAEQSDAKPSDAKPKLRTAREHSMNLEPISPMESVWFESLSDLVANFNKREEYPNNIWINALGNLNFSSSGNSQLYGFNAGYDYYIKSIRTAIGGYGGYGYGVFKGGYNNFVSNNSNNIFAGLYSRTFIGNNEIDVTINSSFGFVNEELRSGVPNMPLLNLFGQRYGYNVLNIEGSASYGYAFNLSKGYILKPFLGFNYYVLQSSNINHDGKTASNFLVNTHNNVRHGFGAIIGVEGRKYWANQSYIFISGQFKQDVVLLKNNLNESGHATTQSGITNNGSDLGAIGSQNILYVSYAKANLQSSVFVTGGGELGLGRFYLNGSLNFQNAISDNSFGFGFNLGARVIF
ncbi:autotransporter domain-containing protein [Helicobacter muridarum]|uniref:Autotransporter domain-containing protein n=1 Tax=Helicobacter muridarum TaxID=216 RepID=A0A099TXV3_9HELI|nr:vacuolating cytotoxin domain-containing protein [Helicobacter muridarum]TLE00062.1 autotransporter domain-containing protein [Helicobacter muridarum]STQ86091.1 toxin-like outer membrane protein [Helicobacter muridarum]